MTKPIISSNEVVLTNFDQLCAFNGESKKKKCCKKYKKKGKGPCKKCPKNIA